MTPSTFINSFDACVGHGSDSENYKGVRVKYTTSEVWDDPTKSNAKSEKTVFVEADGGGLPAISFHIAAASINAAKDKAHREIDAKLRYYSK